LRVILEIARLFKSNQWMLARGNVLGQAVLGVAALVVGVLIGRAT